MRITEYKNHGAQTSSKLKTFALESPFEKDKKTCYMLGENIFNGISDKGLLSKIYEELNSKNKIQLKNR